MKTEIVKIKVDNSKINHPNGYHGFSIYEVEISSEGRKTSDFKMDVKMVSFTL